MVRWLIDLFRCDHDWFVPMREREGLARFKVCSKCGRLRPVSDEEAHCLPRRWDD